jgi:hypothetical protein
MPTTKKNGILPFVSGVSYAYKEDIACFIKIQNQVTIVFNTGKDWIPVYSKPSTLLFHEKAERTQAGMLYKQEVKIQYPGKDKEAVLDFEDLEQRPLLIKLTYNTREERVVGEPEVPAQMLAGFESKDKSVYTVAFSCQSTSRAPHL